MHGLRVWKGGHAGRKEERGVYLPTCSIALGSSAGGGAVKGRLGWLGWLVVVCIE